MSAVPTDSPPFLCCIFGKEVGVFPNTPDWCAYLGVMNLSIWQAYRTRQIAEDVFEEARHRGLVGRNNREPPRGFTASRLRPMNVATPRNSGNSPMVGFGHEKRYYAVYFGYQPGVYDNWCVVISAVLLGTDIAVKA